MFAPEKYSTLLHCSNCVIYTLRRITGNDNDQQLCTTCNKELTLPEERSRANVDEIKLKCQNAKQGCELIGGPGTLAQHDRTCIYRTYNCKFDDCEWTGVSTSLLKHVQEKHVSSYIISRWQTSTSNEIYDKLILMHAWGSIFYFHQKVKNETVYWALQYIGDPVDVKKFSYNISIGRQIKRTLYVTEACCDDLLTIDQIIDMKMCVELPLSLFEKYVKWSTNDYLSVNITNDEIMRCQILNCEGSATRRNLLAHVKENHSDSYIITFWEKPVVMYKPSDVVLMEMEGSLFYASMNIKNDSIIYWIVQYIGEPEDAENYQFRVQYQCENSVKVCYNSSLEIDELIEKNMGIQSPLGRASTFRLSIEKTEAHSAKQYRTDIQKAIDALERLYK